MPTYAMIIALNASILVFTPFNVKMSVVLVVAALTFLLPLLAMSLMYRMGYISGFALKNREERFVPFVIAIASYVACWLYLVRSSAPLWLESFIVGAIVAAIISCIITRWWKISIHTTSISGVLAMICGIASKGYAMGDMLPLVSVVVLLVGAVASARLELERHTMGQVVAGCACGFVCVYATMALF